MPGFDPYTLREEEHISGFDTAEDESTFLLERIPAYPGKTPPATEGSSEPPVAHAPQQEEDILPDATVKQDRAEYDEREERPEEQLAEGQSASAPLLDEDLMSLLREDLEKSKKKKKEREESVQQRDEAIPVAHTLSTDDTGNDMELDLSSIEAVHPSAYKESVAGSVSPESEEKKKRGFALASWTTAGIVLALLLLAGGAYYFGLYHPAPNLVHETIQHNQTTVHNEAGHQNRPDIHNKPIATGDSAKAHSSQSDSVPKAAPPASAIVSHEAGHEQPKAIAHVEQSSAHSPSPSAAQTPKEISSKEAIPEPRKQSTLKEPIAKESVLKESAPKEILKKTPPLFADRSTETNINRQPFKKQPVVSSPVGEYVVQVYSSPSADDAGEWLDQLRQKNVSNAFITTQSIRGQTWHRVRFGTFATREEAETKALQVGFSNSWIVRVR